MNKKQEAKLVLKNAKDVNHLNHEANQDLQNMIKRGLFMQKYIPSQINQICKEIHVPQEIFVQRLAKNIKNFKK